MATLLTVGLAVFAVWEWLIMILPFRVPAWLQPALVAGFAVAAQYLPQRILMVIAVTGVVALFHAAVSAGQAPVVVRHPPRGRVPRL